MRPITTIAAVLFGISLAWSAAPVSHAAPIIVDHRDGCHRWHSCPSDNGTYVCGDTGHYDYCPENRPKQVAPPQQPKPAPVEEPAPTLPTAPVASERPTVDWRTYDVDPLFSGYWNKRGGLAIFGLAKTSVYREKGILTQIFERNRIEYHPENKAPYNYQLGLLGEERLVQTGRIWQNDLKAQPQAGCRYFEETGHNLCEPFLSYWRQHGIESDGKRGYSEAESLALFGYPVTENENGTQWFQRARFEDHGADGVLLGLLGNEVYAEK